MQSKHADPPVRAVILNGASSSGKSTLIKALHAALDGPWLAAGFDVFLDMLHTRYYRPPLFQRVLGNLSSGGDIAHSLVRGMHGSLAALAHAGHPLLVDHVLLHKAWVDDLRMQLAGLRVLWVGVHCPFDELVARERARGDRTIGAAAAQVEIVHMHAHYDIDVDTHALSAAECVEHIVQKMRVKQTRD